MPVAQFQGTINIPLFLAPYVLGLTPGGGTQFNINSEWAVLTLQAQYMNVVGSPPASPGMFLSLEMYSPFAKYLWTNNLAKNLTGSTINEQDIFVCADGKMYVAPTNGIDNAIFNYAENYWCMQNVNISNNILSPNRTMINGNQSFPETLIMGKANFPAFGIAAFQPPALCGHRNHGNAAFMPPQFPYAPVWTGYTNWLPPTSTSVLTMQCQPDRDKVTTHFVALGTTGGAPFFAHSSVIFIPGSSGGALVSDKSSVTIDNGLGATFAANFNSTSSNPFLNVSKAPYAWLINLGSSPISTIKYLLFSVDCTRYWAITMQPQGALGLVGTFNNQNIQSLHIDPTGVAYAIAPGMFSPTNTVAHSYGFNLPWYPIAVNMGNVPAFQLPCPPACESAN